jgi:hypothetical protein
MIDELREARWSRGACDVRLRDVDRRRGGTRRGSSLEAQIGDLEILFGVAFGLLTLEQQSRFFADPGIIDLLETLLLGREAADRRCWVPFLTAP